MRRVFPGLVCASFVLGCGAKTGLLVPERDAEADAEPDAQAPPQCLEVGFEAGDVVVDLETQAELAIADVLFLVDATGSMSQEIRTIQNRLRDAIVPGVAAEIPDVRVGVAFFADFPVEPFGVGSDVPFELLLPVTDDLVAAQSAVDRLPLDMDGNDGPEAQVEAMYQVATGEGLGDWILPSPGCPTGGAGYPCFRREALPVVLLFTDAPFHNGPPPDLDMQYFGITPPPHQWQDAVDALASLGVRFIGLDSASVTDLGGELHLTETAVALGSVDLDGNPLVFDIGDTGSGLDETVVDAVKTLATRVKFDVDAIVEDAPGDAIDGRVLVSAVRPLSANPPDGVDAVGDQAFLGVVPGTRLTFALTLRNDAIPPTEEPQFVPIRVIFRGDYRTRLDIEELVLVIPGLNGESCPPET